MNKQLVRADPGVGVEVEVHVDPENFGRLTDVLRHVLIVVLMLSLQPAGVERPDDGLHGGRGDVREDDGGGSVVVGHVAQQGLHLGALRVGRQHRPVRR